jgi:hypothetical protein
MLDLEPIKARLAAVPAPPWCEFAESGGWWIQQRGNEGDPLGEPICVSDDMPPGLVAFLVAAPADIQALIAEVERLRAALNTVGTKAEQQLLAFIREQLGRG